MAKVYVVYYWHERLGKWVECYDTTNKERAEHQAEFQRRLGAWAKVEEKRGGQRHGKSSLPEKDQ